jgi:ankyrin repeat protein
MGANIEAECDNGRTPLSWADENSHEAVVQLLVAKGANIEAVCHKGRTPLLWASGNGYETVVRLLESHISDY